MKLSLSVRVAEAACKTRLNVSFDEILDLADEQGYHAICMRASAGGVQSSREELETIRHKVADRGKAVSMVTADFDVPLNNDRGPESLRDIDRSLDVAAALDCDLVRVCIKKREDVDHARRAADRAADRGIRLAHQCHTTTLFEEIEPSVALLEEIDRPNFGLIYEPANLMLCGESYGSAALERLRPHLMNVYLQNHKLDPAGPVELETWCNGLVRFHHIPIWERGGVNFEESIVGLKSIGYDGYVTIHQAFAHLMGPHEAAAQSAEYLRSLGGFDAT